MVVEIVFITRFFKINFERMYKCMYGDITDNIMYRFF